MPRGKNTAGSNPTRSIRCPNEIWERAHRRATFEGKSMSEICQQILEGYGAGLINLPKVTKNYNGVVKE